MKKHARLAAMWGLNAALESNKDLYILCTSFTNMLITAHMYQDRWEFSDYDRTFDIMTKLLYYSTDI